ncbi:MAG: rhodanese-like domain-containing protein [Phycisphaerales bacterium]|nr:rhodanese-like domain-containing protein [Phycisphaerales bacterium]
MTTQPRWFRPFIVTLIAVGLLLPLAIHWLAIGRVSLPTDFIRELYYYSRHPDAGPICIPPLSFSMTIVDVRPASAYTEKHLDDTLNWPYEQIVATTNAEQIPEEFRNKNRPLLLICESGILSGFATHHLRSLGHNNVANITGGIQAWIGMAGKAEENNKVRHWLGRNQFRIADGSLVDFPSRELTQFEQWIAVISGFGVKPTYMLLSLILIAVLWRSKASDLVALRWAMIFFFVGEAFCAANYLAANNTSDLFEFLHSYGMVLSFAFVTFAAAQAVDHRIIKYSDPKDRCAAIGLCRSCIKYETHIPCGLRRCFLLLMPMLMLLAMMPWTSELQATSYNSRIFGTFYNYSHPVLHQIYEMRLAPALAIILLAIATAILALNKNNAMLKSKILFAAAAGLLGFGFLRWILFVAYRDNLLWFESWEEITELLFIVGTIAVLWIFRHGLWRETKMEPAMEPRDGNSGLSSTSTL